MERAAVDWRKDSELLEVERKLVVERAKRESAESRLPSLEARAQEIEQQLQDVEAFASVGRMNSADVEKAKRAIEAHREVLNRHRGDALTAAETIAALERALVTVRAECIRRADVTIRQRVSELTAKLEELLVPVIEVNEELESVYAAALFTLPSPNTPEGVIVQKAGVAAASGFSQSLAFLRPPVKRTLTAWCEMKNAALDHAEQSARRRRGGA